MIADEISEFLRDEQIQHDENTHQPVDDFLRHGVIILHFG
jgi:hypothetical protein